MTIRMKPGAAVGDALDLMNGQPTPAVCRRRPAARGDK